MYAQVYQPDHPFYDHLDCLRYHQPWIFYYPSGARLDTTSFLLRTKLYELYRKYHFESLCVVAYRMGGLVSRSAIIAREDNYHRFLFLIYLPVIMI